MVVISLVLANSWHVHSGEFVMLLGMVSLCILESPCPAGFIKSFGLPGVAWLAFGALLTRQLRPRFPGWNMAVYSYSFALFVMHLFVGYFITHGSGFVTVNGGCRLSQHSRFVRLQCLRPY